MHFVFCLLSANQGIKGVPQAHLKRCVHACMPQPAFAESCAQLWVAYPMAQKEKLLKKKKHYKSVDWASPKPCRTAQEERGFI